MEAKLNALMENQVFIDKVESAGSFEKVAELFAAEGIEVTAEELMNANIFPDANDELSEESLDAVSGGAFVLAFKSAIEYLKRKYISGGSLVHVGSSGGSHSGGGGRLG